MADNPNTSNFNFATMTVDELRAYTVDMGLQSRASDTSVPRNSRPDSIPYKTHFYFSHYLCSIFIALQLNLKKQNNNNYF